MSRLLLSSSARQYRCAHQLRPLSQKLVLAPTSTNPFRRNYSNAINPHEKIEPNYYKILGISRDATEAEIRTAYLRLVGIYHPDRNDDPSAKKQFVAVKDAYDLLYDSRKRRDYDERWKRQNPIVMSVSPVAPKGKAMKGKPEPAKNQQAEPKVKKEVSAKEKERLERVQAMEREKYERRLAAEKWKKQKSIMADALRKKEEADKRKKECEKRQENERRKLEEKKKSWWSLRAEPEKPKTKQQLREIENKQQEEIAHRRILEKEERDRLQNESFERQIAAIKAAGGKRGTLPKAFGKPRKKSLGELAQELHDIKMRKRKLEKRQQESRTEEAREEKQEVEMREEENNKSDEDNSNEVLFTMTIAMIISYWLLSYVKLD